jgi:diguanylate cyclase (GGDEF)-like protein
LPIGADHAVDNRAITQPTGDSQAGACGVGRVRAALKFIFPGAVVVALALASLTVDGAEAMIGDRPERYGRVVYGGGLALAWVFHRSRIFVVLLALGLTDTALVDDSAGGELGLAYATVLVALTGVMGPMRDRGLLSRGGLAQVAMGTALLFGARAMLSDEGRLATFMTPLALPFDQPLWRDLPTNTAAAIAVGLAGVVFGYWRWRGAVDRGMMWAMLLLVVGAHPGVGEAHTSLMHSAAGLILTLSVVETSYLLAYRDDLTGLAGRRALMQYLDGISGTYTIAMVDVDHFKIFNDRHGHDVGDQVLRMVASRLAQTPGGAKAYRYGGEEFTLLFPGRTREDALPHVEAVRATIEGSRFALRSWRRPRKRPEGAPRESTRRSQSLSVTVSIGVADSAGDDDSAEVVLKRADQALYRAKTKGRNQVSR